MNQLNKIEKTTVKDQTMYRFYLKEIHKIPMLSHEEEQKLAVKSMNGHVISRNRLILSNLRFVVSIVNKYKSNELSQMDLINEGNMGLIRAAERFNPNKGYHFISYAVWWIKQAILFAIQQKAHPIRLPLNRKAELRRLHAAKNMLANHEFDSSGNIEAIAEIANVKPEDASLLLQISKDQISLDAPIANSEDACLLETIPDNHTSMLDTNSNLNDLKSELREQLQVLTNKEKDIIIHRFGLDGKQAQSLQKIGNRMELSKERIRQIEKKALLKIRNHKDSSSLQAYLET